MFYIIIVPGCTPGYYNLLFHLVFSDKSLGVSWFHCIQCCIYETLKRPTDTQTNGKTSIKWTFIKTDRQTLGQSVVKYRLEMKIKF